MSSSLKQFQIVGLHGDRNVTLDLFEQATILTDSNGSGKTTVLGLLFALLAKHHQKLAAVRYKCLRLTLGDGTEFEFERQGLVDHRALRSSRSAWHRAFMESLPDSVLAELRTFSPLSRNKLLAALWDGDIDTRSHRGIEHLAGRVGVDVQELVEMLTKADPSNLGCKGQYEALESHLSFQPLYFPTYRRVEEDLHMLGHSDADFPGNSQLIQFGMHDVRKTLNEVMSAIKDTSVEWYSIVNGRMISQLVDGIEVDDGMYEALADFSIVKVVLDRSGDNIPLEKKRSILELVRNPRNLRYAKYKPLVFFLYNLVQIYSKQKDTDDAIKAFAKVINEDFFNDKRVVYDEGRLDISVVDERTGAEVRLEHLSSGEKQLMSLFSRMFFSENVEYFLLFDEPELSLSMEWQRRLLPDVLSTGRCRQLVAATHSPFIFDNELDDAATQLKVEYSDGE
ncbi:MAG: ATP-binding protein [Alphaproteobacteria bacterium]|nr:ATP-binding protein [Alphaproteobacteria bacterium]MCB9797440.1 ATP-binding protein [Alphaproteobacteria bacterium]